MFYRDTDGDYMPTDLTPDQQLIPRLPDGAYQMKTVMRGYFFKPYTPSQETMIDLELPARAHVVREIETFFDPVKTARLTSAGLKHRRGIILYGPPGTGKTSMIRGLFPYCAKHGAVIIVDPNADHLENHIIPMVRKHDHDRPIVIYFDEFDATVRRSFHELLSLLDGMGSPDHLLTIGCTNHMEQIPTAMRARPSRFSLILEVNKLDDRVRHYLAERKYPMLDAGIRLDCVSITADKPIDYLEEACKLALMGYESDEIRDRIQMIDPAAIPENVEETTESDEYE